ncbi:MAG: CAP domain-containing protein [Sulfurovaceae bacterium]|nr:CAP domain-containing protein [Sulfurovaceae bacterium]
MKKISLLIVLFLFTACGDTGSSVATASVERTSDITRVLKTENKDMLTALNLARSVARDCNDGLGIVGPSRALTWNDELYAAAYEHSSDLAQSNTFSHSGSGTEYDVTGMNSGERQSHFFERIESNGYGNFNTLGENIAGGQTNIVEAMEAWLASPAHCTNIMNDKFEEVGIAVVIEEESDFGIYWTQNFGTKL